PSDTGCTAALDLVLQARACAMSEDTVFTVANTKHLLHQGERLADSATAWIRPEIAPIIASRTCPLVFEGRKWMAVTGEHIRVGLIVAQQNVIGRTQLLDQCLFKEQGLGF